MGTWRINQVLDRHIDQRSTLSGSLLKLLDMNDSSLRIEQLFSDCICRTEPWKYLHAQTPV